MKKPIWFAVITVACFVSTVHADSETIRGKVVDQSGKAMEGVMVSAFDDDRHMPSWKGDRMPSYYDEKKKCRVGTMDEDQFYTEASKEDGKCFKSLIAGWQKCGGSLKWGAGGVGLRGAVADKEVGVCFLAPAFAGKKDRIELSLSTLSKQIGDAQCQKLKTALQDAAGDHFKGSSMISIVKPGELSAASQKSLTTALCPLL